MLVYTPHSLCAAAISSPGLTHARMRITSLGNFSENGCLPFFVCIYVRAWLTLACVLITCTEVAERSLDSSTDEEVMLFDFGTSRRGAHIDEKLSASCA